VLVLVLVLVLAQDCYTYNHLAGNLIDSKFVPRSKPHQN